MQPYLFPYIGYFHLMDAADVFVVYDDVQYSKGGWINRNQILVDGSAKWLTMPVEKKPLGTTIHEMDYVHHGSPIDTIANKIRGAYAKAPYYKAVAPFLFELIDQETTNVARFNETILRGVAGALGVKCQIIRASEVPEGQGLRGQDRVLDICRRLEPRTYVNAIGGVELYENEVFEEKGMDLRFILSDSIRYDQFHDPFVPNLSIIDVLMFNGFEGTEAFVGRYKLVNSKR